MADYRERSSTMHHKFEEFLEGLDQEQINQLALIFDEIDRGVEEEHADASVFEHFQHLGAFFDGFRKTLRDYADIDL